MLAVEPLLVLAPILELGLELQQSDRLFLHQQRATPLHVLLLLALSPVLVLVVPLSQSERQENLLLVLAAGNRFVADARATEHGLQLEKRLLKFRMF